ncbi:MULTISPECIES: TetR/AcrR family transcriptional regulator [unclassified Streptomyces]|uniref:TetR/AcrR family transcriptional regulator n=1 Tax=Streptomyces TaxID=1883 RepID=UPI00082397C6|nr:MULTISPECIES: TetR/AcrR family transcriptional regulator [unclassified Streptomyces]AWN30954.1 TetR/AcrR family transcriptional regulator [Streptomyces sp. NEAU-S7GS2]MYT13038.1 TetR family transcriptional regulator [Streptomyces sp. SID4951]SCK44490.1 transcriptional regulator, TetR family [Streptomyces sp. SceaMP-e96]
MAVARTPRHKWIDEGLRALAAGGPDAVQIEALAKALGVSKGGFYGYFSDRRALLQEMLDRWEREITDDVEARVEQEGGDAKARLRHLFAIVDTGDGLDTTITTDLAIRDWARHDPAVAERLRRVDNRHMDYLRSLFRAFCADEDDVEARCLITFSLYIADRFVLADHGDRSRADVHELTTRWLLDSPRLPGTSTARR